MKHFNFVLLVLIGNCCLYSIPSIAQTEFKTKWANGTIYVKQNYTAPQISRIIIFSGVHDMDVNKKIVDLFYEMGIRATNGYLLFPPLENHTEEELTTLARQKGFDAMIWVDIKNKMMINEYAIRMEVDLSVHDIQKNIKYLRVLGYTFSDVPPLDKGIFRFFNAVVPELNSALTPKADAGQ